MRGFALFLLALGFVLGVIGVFGAVSMVANKWPAGGGPLMVVVFLGLIAAAAGLLIVAVSILRRTPAIGAVPTVVNGKVGPYAADATTHGRVGGVEYSVRYELPVRGKNGRASSLCISVPVEAAGAFRIGSETWFDRFGQRVGLAVKLQTGDEAFDTACYVRTDAVEFTREYLADPLKRIAIQDVCRLGFPRVALKDGTVTAEWPGFDPATHDKPNLVAEVAARLVLLARDLPPKKPEFDNHVGAGRKKWQVVLWAFLGLYGFGACFLTEYTATRGEDHALAAAFVYVPALPGFAWLAGWLLRGTSTSHYAWGYLMLGAVVLLPLGSSGAVSFLNGALDDSPPTTHTQAIVEKYTSNTKGGVRYRVKCASWRPGGGTESYAVGAGEYNAVVVGRSHMVVVTRAGALGVEWLESNHVVP